MKHSIIVIVGVALLSILASGDPPVPPLPPKPQKQVGVEDPRFARHLTLIYRNGADEAFQPHSNAILVFAREDTERPNTVIGIDGSFTDEQIVTALKRFYREWKPSKDYPSATRPPIILAKQNWGSGSALATALKSLSAEYQLHVYHFDAVLTHFEPRAGHPTPGDKRLSELIEPDAKSTPKSQTK